MEERFLLARLQHKDEKALAQLIDQYAGYVLATVRAAGAGVLAEADLEEAAADTFVKLWGAAASVRPEKGGLKAYLGAIARNEARSRVRRARPVLPLEEDFLSPADQQAQQALEEYECKLKLVDKLMRTDAAVLRLREEFKVLEKIIADNRKAMEHLYTIENIIKTLED